MNHQLSLYKDELAPQAALHLPPGNGIRAIYVIHGGLRVRACSRRPKIDQFRGVVPISD